MTERENFLERWSRRKREGAADEPAPSQSQNVEADKKPDAVAPPVGTEAEKPFDLENLPSLESITAETDIRDFLQPGVPTELRREALRRAWSADPGIRDFVGLAENSGDFNDPTAMVGFGPIEPVEVARLMAQFVLSPGEKKAAQASEQSADQGVGQMGTTSDSDLIADRDDKSDDARTNCATHVASQKDDTNPGSASPSTDQS